MAIVKTVDKLREHIPLNEHFSFDVILGYVDEVEHKYIENLIGEALYTTFNAEPTETIPKKVWKLFEKASANLAVLRYIPVGNVQISDMGIAAPQNQNAKPAEWWQIRDLQRSFLTTGTESIDAALRIMEKNKNLFPDWTTSENYTEFNELFVTRTDIFQRYCNINDSRRTFLALRPLLLEVQQAFFNWLDENTKQEIKSAGNTYQKAALAYCQGAQANFAIAKAATNGLFDMAPTGIYMRTTEIKGEKAQMMEPSQLKSFVKARMTAGNEYLKLLKNYLEVNAAQFSNYTPPSATDNFPREMVNTKSILSI